MRVCEEAEASISVSNATCALQSRRALEIAVKWMYRYDKGLTVPYQDNLSSLTIQTEFVERVEKIEVQKAAMTASLSELEDTFNALMQRAFKGELV